MRVSLPSDSNLLRGHVTQNVGCCAVSRKQFHGSANVYCLIFFLLVFSSRLFLLLLRQRCDPKEAAGAKSEFTPEAPRLLYGSVPTTFLPKHYTLSPQPEEGQRVQCTHWVARLSIIVAKLFCQWSLFTSKIPVQTKDNFVPFRRAGVLFCFCLFVVLSLVLSHNLFHAHLLSASRSCNSVLLLVARPNNINKSITKTGWRDDAKSPATRPKNAGSMVKQPSLVGHQLTCVHMHE